MCWLIQVILLTAGGAAIWLLTCFHHPAVKPTPPLKHQVDPSPPTAVAAPLPETDPIQPCEVTLLRALAPAPRQFSRVSAAIVELLIREAELQLLLESATDPAQRGALAAEIAHVSSKRLELYSTENDK
jgi:hypothetical protein